MNPAQPGPATYFIRLADGRTTPPVLVPAVSIRNLYPEMLDSIEAIWSRDRDALIAAGATIENSHWDWRNKVWPVLNGRLALVGIECDGECQGLMALAVPDRPAVLTPGARVVYVDYLEVAPRNLRVGGHRPRFLGVGTALMAEAILISQELGFGGLVGHHSLGQAEQFYTGRCRMTRVGPDPAYYDLVYFEYPEGVASAWLATVRDDR